MEKLTNLEAVVEHIIYSNDANGFTVCEVATDETIVCAVGFMPYIGEGDNLILSGVWGVHPDYGEQFKVSYYEKTEPRDSDSILRFLSSGIISGIGAVTARRIVDKFGDDALNTIKNNPGALSAIKGISPGKAEAISACYIEKSGVQSLVMFLGKFGITPDFAMKIYKQYGNEGVDIIKADPYCLCDEVSGVGFKKADKIAVSMGVIPADKRRVESGIIYILSYNTQNGHTYLPRDMLCALCAKFLGVDNGSVQNAIVAMLIEKRLYSEIIDEKEIVYLYDMYMCELGIAQKLRVLAGQPIERVGETDEYISRAEGEMGVTLEKNQREAVACAVSGKVTIITGGPGTGKTTIIKTVLSIFQQLNLRVELCAPTGRASKRMATLCGREAKTIHRLLEVGYDDSHVQRFMKNITSPLDADVVIVDEMSMVDVILMDSLLCALGSGTRLIMVGDADQLPSVGPGSVLFDMIDSGTIKTVYLNEIFRQAKESMIVVNAHKINSGEYPVLNKSDFYFLPTPNAEAIAPAIVDLCCRRLAQKYGIDDMFKIQVISPSRKGSAGVANLNACLQAALNPASAAKTEKTGHGFTFRTGDKVMQIKNNYDIAWSRKDGGAEGQGVFNGDEGIITNIDPDRSCLTVEFDDDRVVKYEFLQLDELEPAYAITVHKSQGSEFDIVVIPMYNAPPMLLARNLLYTAVTRARKLAVLVGDERVIKKMVDNNRHAERYSSLNHRLKEMFNE